MDYSGTHKTSTCTTIADATDVATVPTFNSCIKCVGIIYDRMPDCQPVSWPKIYHLLSERSLDWHATYVIDVLYSCLTFYPWVFVQPGTG